VYISIYLDSLQYDARQDSEISKFIHVTCDDMRRIYMTYMRDIYACVNDSLAIELKTFAVLLHLRSDKRSCFYCRIKKYFLPSRTDICCDVSGGSNIGDELCYRIRYKAIPRLRHSRFQESASECRTH